MEHYLESEDEDGRRVNVVDGLLHIAAALDGVAVALHRLGNGSASTSFGAVEAASMLMKEGLDNVASSLGSAVELLHDLDNA